MENKEARFESHFPFSAFRFPFLLERVSGFEPEINGFANRRLWPLGYTRKCLEGTTGLEPARNSSKDCLLDRFAFVPEIGTRREIRTLTFLFLRQTPLPIWPRVRKNLVRAAGFEPANTCFQNKPV